MLCSTCATSLSSGTYEGTAVHGCPICSGRFVAFAALQEILASEQRPRSDAEHAAALKKAGSAAGVAPDDAPQRTCPECTNTMTRRINGYDSGVWVDACPDHGVWLDDGELPRLEAMAEAVRRGGSIQSAEHSEQVGMSHNVDETDNPYLDMIRHRARDNDGWMRKSSSTNLFDLLF